MNNRPYGVFQHIADKKTAIGFFLWESDYQRTLILPHQHYKLYRPWQVNQLFSKTRAKKCFNQCVRFLVRTNKKIIFAEEGEPVGEIPAHGQMTEDNKKISLSACCLTAGNIYFNDQDEITEISCKSGDFRPSIDSIQFALDAIFARNMKIADTVFIRDGQGDVVFSIFSSEARAHYLKYRAQNEGAPIENDKKLISSTTTLAIQPQKTDTAVKESLGLLNRLRVRYQRYSTIKKALICAFVGLLITGLIFSVIGFVAGLAAGALFVVLAPLFAASTSAATISVSIVGTVAATGTSTHYYLMRGIGVPAPQSPQSIEERSLPKATSTTKAPYNAAPQNDCAALVIDHARQAFRYILI